MYFDENGVLTDTTSFTELYILKYCAVSAGYWDATNKRIVPGINNEQHGTRMPSEVHLLNHLALGVVYESGLSVEVHADRDGSSVDDVGFIGGAGYLQDEDNRSHIDQHDIGTNVHVMHMEGPSGYWRTDNSSSAMTRTTGSGLAAYNRYTGSNWELAEMTDEYYGISYIYAFPGVTEQWVVVMGQNEYDSVDAARAAAQIRPSLGSLPAPEYKLIASVVFQTSSTYTNSAKARVISCDNGDFQDWRHAIGTSSPGSTGAVSSVNGKTGTVILTLSDIGAAAPTRTFATTALLPGTGDFTGQWTYTSDYGVFWRWVGGKWRPIDAKFATTTARDGAITSPTTGDTCEIGSGVTWVTYQYSGSTWVSQDTGWLAITPQAGWTASGNPAVRVRDGIVTFRGSLSGTPVSGANGIGTISSEAYPPDQDRTTRTVANGQTVSAPALGYISTTGDITIVPAALSSSTFYLGCFSGYSVD
jgi:hypothetical protein